MKQLSPFAFYILLLSTVPSFSLQAQSAKQDSARLSRELTLEREYNPVLEDAFKINQLPEIKEPEAPESPVEFSKYTFPLTIPPFLHTIYSQDYLTELAKTKERGYLNLGLGTLLNIDGDLGYQLLNTDVDYLNIYASHRSANSWVTYLQNDQKQKMKFNDNYGGINFRRHFEKVQFNTGAKYTCSSFNYYGKNAFPPSPVSGYENDNQANNLLEVHAGVSSKESSDLYFNIHAAYTFFQQKYGYWNALKGRKESRFLADFDLYTHFNSTTGIGLAGYMKTYCYALPPESYPDDSKKFTGNYDYISLSFNPYFTFEGDNWNARIGASTNMQMGGIKKFMLAPDIHFDWKPADQFLLYLLATGGIKDNSNYASYYKNRYIDPAFRIYDTQIPLDAVLGARFSILSGLSLDLFTGYQSTKNEPFYIIDNQKIVPQYAKAQSFKLGGLFKYAYRDVFDLNLKLTYYKWNINKWSEDINDEIYYSQSKPFAWNKPSWETELNLAYQIPVIPLQLDLLYHGEWKRKAKILSKEMPDGIIRMKDIHDLSFKSTYPINKTISVYAVINNLLSQKYDLWLGYPVQNFNIMGGISVKF